MMQLVVWLVIATVNPAGRSAAQDHGFHGQRFVAAYTTEAECQKHARSVTARQQRSLAEHPEWIDENYACMEVVVKTECHNYTDGRC
jgi:hypothetical protein